MNDVILLSLGLTAIFAPIFYFILRRINKRLRRYVLRFEQIKHKFE